MDRKVTLAELIALNDEIRALVRAGVPLGRGLFNLGIGMPRRIGKAAQTIGQRMERGEPLEQILEDQQHSIPPIYGAVVSAGLHSGRLAIALENVGSTLRRVAELRRVVAQSIAYPLFLVVLACVLFAELVQPTFGVLRQTTVNERLAKHPWLDRFVLFCDAYGSYAVWPAVFLVVVAVIWWFWSARSTAAQAGWFARTAGWIPGVGRLLRLGRLAAFADILRLLVSSDLPLNRAVLLAANATGDRRLQHDANRLAENIQKGQISAISGHRAGIPPLLRWLLTSGQSRDHLVSALTTMANGYSDRTVRLGDRLQVYLPLLFTLSIGGTLTMAYAASVIVPWVTVLSGFS